METRQFITEIVKYSAWPVTVLLLLVLFGPSIRKAIGLLSKLRFGGFEAEFSKNLEKIDSSLQKIPPQSRTNHQQESGRSILKTLLDIATQSPTAAILEAWRNIEIELMRLKAPDQKLMPAWAIGDLLLKQGKISAELHSILRQLYVVRNEVAHTRGRLDIGERQAVTYIHSSIRSIEYLQSLAI